MGYYSAIKKHEITCFTGKWMELEAIMWSKVSQIQKDKGCMFYMWKVDFKDKYVHRYIHVHIYIYRDMTCLWQLACLKDSSERQKVKREWQRVSNIDTHCVCVGRLYIDAHWKLLNNEQEDREKRGYINVIKLQCM
jgi:hypothetical protein